MARPSHIPHPRVPYADMERTLNALRWGKRRRIAVVSGYSLWSWEYTPPYPHARILISAGVHGDEPAPVEAVWQLLQKRPDWLQSYAITLFPCLNPWGYEHNTRLNERGQDVNRLWNRRSSDEVCAAKRVLGDRQFDLTLCLHEDYDAAGFYLYEVARMAPFIGIEVVQRVSRILPIDPRHRIENRIAQGGVVFRNFKLIRKRKFWPEALYHVQHHSPRTLTIETPTHFSIQKRVRAHVEALHSCLQILRNVGPEVGKSGSPE